MRNARNSSLKLLASALLGGALCLLGGGGLGGAVLGACGAPSSDVPPSRVVAVTWSNEWQEPSRFVVRGVFRPDASPRWEVKDCAIASWRPLVAEGDERRLRFVHEAVCGVRAVEPHGFAPNDVLLYRSPPSLLEGATVDASPSERAVLSDGDLNTGYRTASLTATFLPKQKLRGLYVAVHEPAAPQEIGNTIYYSPKAQSVFSIEIRGLLNQREIVQTLDSQSDFPSRRRYFEVPLDEVTELTFSAEAPVDLRELQLLATDEKPLVSPWVLSVNANPSAQVLEEEGHGIVNDRYHASFLTKAFRRIGWYPPIDLVRGDDPAVSEWVQASYPKPIVVLSGSNAWDYSTTTQRDPEGADRWMWNPLLPAASGGLGHLAPLVRGQEAPLLGLCGGGQILALLRECDLNQVEECYNKWLRRTTGEPIDGFWKPSHVVRAWPGDTVSRVAVEYDPFDTLWAGAGATGRRLTRGLPESHVDALAFEPLRERWDVSATSWHCVNELCTQIPEAFALPPAPFSVVGTQFHPERAVFSRTDVPDDESTDPASFLSAVLEQFALELFRDR